MHGIYYPLDYCLALLLYKLCNLNPHLVPGHLIVSIGYLNYNALKSFPVGLFSDLIFLQTL